MSESLTGAELAAKVRTLYPDARVEVSGEGCDFEMIVVSDAFAGMPVMRRQQSILKLFAGELKSGKLHALSVRARTETEIRSSSSHLVQLEI